MITVFPAPRWLPATIGVLAGLLALKSVTLIRAVATDASPVELSFFTSNARAAAPQAEPKPAGTKPADAKPADPKSGDPKAAETKPAEAKPADAKAAGAPEAEPPVTTAERTILLELRQRRQELESREAALAERESVITAAQEKLGARVEELRGLQQRLEALDTERRKQEDTSWQGLVKLYETMKPREAATIFNDLAMSVLVPVMDRVKDAKAAQILAAMDPDKARLLTQALAKLRSRAEVEPRPAAPARPNPAQAPTPPPPQPRQPNS